MKKRKKNEEDMLFRFNAPASMNCSMVFGAPRDVEVDVMLCQLTCLASLGWFNP